jgi:hypothetical protein
LSRRIIILFALLFGVLGITSVGVKAEPVIGVEVGDWIEYNAEYTGTLPSPENHLIKIRYEVQEINGPIVTLYQTSENAEGNQNQGTFQVNIENKTGSNRRLEILEANLNIGTVLFDDEYVGEVIIERIEIEYFAGSNREVLYLNKWYETGYCWDRQTGFQLMDTFESERYTRVLIAEQTNMWEAQISTEPLQSTEQPTEQPTDTNELEQPTDSVEESLSLFNIPMELLLAIVAIMAIIIVAIIAFMIRKRRGKEN